MIAINMSVAMYKLPNCQFLAFGEKTIVNNCNFHKIIKTKSGTLQISSLWLCYNPVRENHREILDLWGIINMMELTTSLMAQWVPIFLRV